MSDNGQNPKINTFFERLERLDAGGRAQLKRNAGQTLSASRKALGLFYSLLPGGISHTQEEIYFLVATLYPLADGNGKGDLGAALRQARNDKNTKGLDRRLQILLDADEAQLSYRLRQTIKFLQSNRVRVNWPALLEDLLAWNYNNRPVQRRWARSYYGE